MIMDKKSVFSEEAPKPIGPYSQAISAGGFLWCSGQIPIDPKTGKTVGETAAQQAIQVLENLKAVLAAGGATLQDVVRTGIFLADLDDFAVVNDVYARYFPEDGAPARSTVEVNGLPRDVKVEIEAVALLR
jgi:2-iminobutanoate/2-iminopropanoate deaminase